MKHLISMLGIAIYCVMSIEAFSCGGSFVPYIDGPSEVEVNSVVQYKHVFDDGYRNSSGGYFGTQWSLTGKGVIGYGESVYVDFTNLATGTYTLTAKDQFGSASACYGCLSNTTYTKTINIVPLRPDFKVEIMSAIADPLFDCRESSNLTYKVTNIGSTASPKVGVKMYWTSGANEFSSFDDIIPAIPAGGIYQVSNVRFRTPCISTSSEKWTFIIFVDPTNVVWEKNESNNKATAERTINKLNGRVAQENDDLINLVSVSDVYGNHIWTKGVTPFDFTTLHEGMYVYKYENSENVRIRKVLKR